MIDELKKNIDVEIDILREIASCINKLEVSDRDEKKLLEESVNSLINSLRIINSSIPRILEGIEGTNGLQRVSEDEVKKIEIKIGEHGEEKTITLRKGSDKQRLLDELKRVAINVDDTKKESVITIAKGSDKIKALKELSIGEETFKSIKRERLPDEEKYVEYAGSRGYLKFANKLFLPISNKMTKKEFFKDIYPDIKKANLDILFETYISMMFLSSLLAFIAAVIIYILMIFIDFENFGINSLEVIFSKASGWVWLPIVAPVATFFGLYYYPSTEKSSISKKIEQELPFAALHMKAVSGSGINPTEIFRIIATGREYPYLKREIRKILNQINLYGYDLVTAINNTARNTPSQNFSELLSGLATTISSGGDLATFFDKRAETLLGVYRLEREKYIKLAETFMDIYISVVIAAPMMLMLLFILLSFSAFQINLGQSDIAIIIVAGVGLINAFFITFLHMKQPSY